MEDTVPAVDSATTAAPAMDFPSETPRIDQATTGKETLNFDAKGGAPHRMRNRFKMPKIKKQSRLQKAKIRKFYDKNRIVDEKISQCNNNSDKVCSGDPGNSAEMWTAESTEQVIDNSSANTRKEKNKQNMKNLRKKDAYKESERIKNSQRMVEMRSKEEYKEQEKKKNSRRMMQTRTNEDYKQQEKQNNLQRVTEIRQQEYYTEIENKKNLRRMRDIRKHEDYKQQENRKNAQRMTEIRKHDNYTQQEKLNNLHRIADLRKHEEYRQQETQQNLQRITEARKEEDYKQQENQRNLLRMAEIRNHEEYRQQEKQNNLKRITKMRKVENFVRQEKQKNLQRITDLRNTVEEFSCQEKAKNRERMKRIRSDLQYVQKEHDSNVERIQNLRDDDMLRIAERQRDRQIGAQGSVIYVPTDVNEMEQSLPRSINNINVIAIPVEFKRHMRHATSYLKGLVRKDKVEAAGKYLQDTELYKKYGIRFSDAYDVLDMNDDESNLDTNECEHDSVGREEDINKDEEFANLLHEEDDECLLIDLNERRSCEVDINTYNRIILNLMESNVDLQLVVDEYAVASYIVDYVAKGEAGLSKGLKDLQTELDKGDRNLQDRLRCIMNKFLNGHVISTSEAVYHCLGTPITEFSRSAIFINTARSDTRVAFLKSTKQLQAMDPDSTDIVGKDILTHYSERKALDDVCLAEYAAYYFQTAKKTRRDKNLDSDDEGNESDTEKDDSENNRRRTARIVRHVRYTYEKDPDNFFREQLLLFLPWRNEEEEIESINWSAKFNENKELIERNRDNLFKLSSDRLDDAMLAAEQHRQIADADEIEDFEKNQISKDQEIDILVQPASGLILDVCRRHHHRKATTVAGIPTKADDNGDDDDDDG
nr:intracellular protein transport protein USO1-like [Aedes albopictus]